jgi:hypothetical protein
MVMTKLTYTQYNLVIRLVSLAANRVREQIAYDLQEQSRSSDGDMWLEEIDRESSVLWAILNGVEE